MTLDRCPTCHGKGCLFCHGTGFVDDDARKARDEALDQVEENADPDWNRAAYEALLKVARRMEEFTSDHVMAEMRNYNVTTHELRAMGPVMIKGAKNAIIAKAEKPSRPSARRSLHASPRTVWRSLIHAKREH